MSLAITGKQNQTVVNSNGAAVHLTTLLAQEPLDYRSEKQTRSVNAGSRETGKSQVISWSRLSCHRPQLHTERLTTPNARAIVERTERSWNKGHHVSNSSRHC